MGSGNSTNIYNESEILLLPEILSKVLSFLCLEDLKACRQVNSFWENIANEILRPRARVILPRGYIRKFLKLQDEGMKNNHKYPFRSFHLFLEAGFDWNLMEEFRNVDTIKFLDQCGVIVKDLKLNTGSDIYTSSSTNSICNFISLINDKCPYLESFELEHELMYGEYSFSGEPSTTGTFVRPFNNLSSFTYSGFYYNPILLNHLLNRLPNLQRFKINNSEKSSVYDSEFPKLIELIVSAYDNGNLGLLNYFELDDSNACKLADSDIQLLQEMNMKLIKFSGVLSHDVKLKNIHKFLDSTKDTLRKLDLSIECNGYVVFPFPCLGSLNSLTIHSSMITNDLFEKMPNLSYFEVKGYSEYNRNIDELVNIDASPVECPRLRTVSFCNYNPSLWRVILRKLCHARLCRVRIPGDDELLIQIYANFPNLQELCIYSTKHLTTKGFTGLTIAELAARSLWPIDSSVYARSISSSPLDREQEILRILSEKPYIGSLRCLRLLEIQQRDSDFSTDTLSDCAVVLGICNAKSILVLKLDVQLSKTSVLALARLPRLETVYYTPGPSQFAASVGSSSTPTTAEWFQELLKTKPKLDIYVKVLASSGDPRKFPTFRRGEYFFEIRKLKINDKYKGDSLRESRYVTLDEFSSGNELCVLCRLFGRNCYHLATYCGFIIEFSAQCCYFVCCMTCLQKCPFIGQRFYLFSESGR